MRHNGRGTWRRVGEQNRESRVEEQKQNRNRSRETIRSFGFGSIQFISFRFTLLPSHLRPLWVFVFGRFTLIPLFCLGAHSFCFCAHCHCTALRPPFAVPFPPFPGPFHRVPYTERKKLHLHLWPHNRTSI